MTTYKIGTYKAGQQIAKEVFESDNLDDIRREFERMFKATVEDEWEGIVEAGEPEDTLYGETFEQAWDRKHFSEDTNNVAVFQVEEDEPLMTSWIYTGMTSNQLH